MNSRQPTLAPLTGNAQRSDELFSTFADRVALQAREREERRRLGLAEQSSIHNSPEVRIRAWEKIHALRLPGNPEHPILGIIAAETGLTEAQIRQEQLVRQGQSPR